MLQLGVTAVTDDLGPVPVPHLFDGNRNGHTGIKERYQLLRNCYNLPDGFLLVSDGAPARPSMWRLLRHGPLRSCAGQLARLCPVYEQHADQLVWQQAQLSLREQQRAGPPRRPCPWRTIAWPSVRMSSPIPRPLALRVPSDLRALERGREGGPGERREQNVARIRAALRPPPASWNARTPRRRRKASRVSSPGCWPEGGAQHFAGIWSR